MAWNKDSPQGAVLTANLIDDAVRENNAQLETALDTEHRFATGGAQHGRHRFGFGTSATRDAIADLLHQGAIFFLEDDGSGTIPDGHVELAVRDQVNTRWVLASGRMLLELASAWSKAQNGYHTVLSIVSNAAASDWSASNFFSLTATQNFTLSNPSNLPADSAGGLKAGGTWIYEITQDGGGSRLMTLGSLFKTQFGVALTLSTDPGAVDLLVCTLRTDGNIHAELIRDSS